MKEKSSYLRNSSKSWAMSILDGSNRSDELTLIIVNVPLAVLVLFFCSAAAVQRGHFHSVMGIFISRSDPLNYYYGRM